MQKVKLSRLPQSPEVLIPNKWTVKSLHEIAKINPDTIGNDYPYTDILYVDIGAVQDFRVRKYEKFGLNERPSRAQRIIKKNDIIVSMVRPYLKAIAKIETDSPNLVCSTGFAVIRAHHSSDADLIFNFLKSYHFEVNIYRQMEGLAYPAITAEVVGNSLMPYSPHESEREKIASILSKVDDLIQKTDEFIKQTQRLKKGLMQRLFTQGLGHTRFKEVHFHGKWLRIPEKWEIVKLKESTSKIGSGVTPLGGHRVYTKKGIPFIRSQNVHFDGLHLEDVAYIPKSIHDEMASTKLQPYDVLLNITGASIGRCTYVPPDFGQGNVNQHVCIIRPTTELNPVFLAKFLSTSLMQNLINSKQGGLSRQGLTFKEIADLSILCPPVVEQKQIASILSSVDMLAQMEKNKRDQFSMLKMGLMQKLLTGQIQVKV